MGSMQRQKWWRTTLDKCQKLMTYKAPGKDFQYRKEPYSEAEIHEIYMAEINAHENQRHKKKDSKTI